MSDTNLAHMQSLLGKDNVSIVYLHAAGDYWIGQDEFCNAFRKVPLSDNLVIHVRFEGLSLTHSLVVPTVEKLMKELGRSPQSVYIFSPNSTHIDAPWENLFWRQYRVSDEFSRSTSYWCNSPPLEDNFKTWALFIGRRTTPRLLALYDVWRDPVLKNNFLTSAMNHPAPEIDLIFDRPDKIYDSLDLWMPLPDDSKIQRIYQQHNFRSFCQNLPITSIDNYAIVDQYNDSDLGENRNGELSKSLIAIGSKYLFELTFETMTLGKTFTPSEKTVRPILAEKPLMVYAPKDFLKNLQNIGFKTFDSLWDESYDQLDGPKRYRAIMDLVKQICMLSKEEQFKLYQASRDICRQNKITLSKYTMYNLSPKHKISDANI